MAAPAPTELLAEDVRDLRESNRLIAVEIKGILTGQATMQTELRIIQRIGAFFAGILVVLVGVAITLSWGASALNSKVEQQGGRLEKIEGRLEKIEQQLGRLDKIEQQLGQLNLNIDRIATPKPKP